MTKADDSDPVLWMMPFAAQNKAWGAPEPVDEIVIGNSYPAPAPFYDGDVEKLCMAHVSPADAYLHSRVFDGSWSGDHSDTRVSAGAVALAARTTDELCCVHTTATSNTLSWTLSTDGGESWTADQTIPDSPDSGSCDLAYSNNTLMLVTKTGSALTWSQFDGATWGGFQAVPGQSASGQPAVREFKGRPYLVYQSPGAGTTDVLWSVYDRAGSTWSTAQKVSVQAPKNPIYPALGVVPGDDKDEQLLGVAVDADGALWWCAYNGGAGTWTEAWQQIPGVADAAHPRLASYNGTLYAFYAGTPAST
ncbi:hypothetical protein ACFV1L_13455 [Kitasatospora sp. NPDC059646]|uniref:hypothetical protein n=1 Tax=Kitasatospora sp. NPDC059646 TaxID=3346893 RepID=UPI0036CB04C8